MGQTASCLGMDMAMAAEAASEPSNDASATSQTDVARAVARLKEVGVNFLAIDFDQTILSIHTGGRWHDTLDELLPFVRPEFKALIRNAFDSDICIAVVTFTAQIKLVRGVLEEIVGIEPAQQIPIRGNDRSWHYAGGGSMDGKQPHMASAVEELETRQNVRITRATTLLIDDDGRNVRIALQEGTRALWFNPNRPHQLFKNITKLV